MSHLTNRELSVLHAEALAGEALRRAERHLAECAACREALAALSAREAALGEALSHEPGDTYFATFADRVNARISEAGGATAPARGVVGRPKTAEREGGGHWKVSAAWVVEARRQRERGTFGLAL